LKRIVGFIVLVALLGVLALTATAAPAADLNTLAAYFPNKAPVFVSVRTDEAYFTTLQTLIDRLNSAFRRADIPALEDSLNEALQSSGVFDEDATFSSEVRPWLGDVASFGLLSLDVFSNDSRRDDDEAPALFAVQITDRAAAEAFIEAALAETDIEAETLGNFNVYTLDDRPLTQLAIGDDVLFVSNDPAALPLEGAPESSLGNSAAFGDALALLPAADYNLTGYLATSDLYEALLANAGSGESLQVFGSSTMGLIENMPDFAFGATILDENALTIDFAADIVALRAAYDAMGISLPDYAPLNPDFLARVPAGTPLVIHANDIQSAYRQGINQLNAQVAMMSEMMQGEMGDAALTEEQVRQAVSAATIAIQGITGLNLEDELLPALTGDFAIYMGLGEALQGEEVSMMSLMGGFPLEFGMVFQITDAAIIPTLVDGIANALNVIPSQTEDGTQFTVGSDTIGGNEVATLRVVPEDSPFPIDLVFGGDDEVFFIGTPASARASLNPDGGLLGDADYQEASANFLPSSSLVYYLGGDGLQPLRELAPLIAGRGNREGVEALNGFLSLISSGSISASYSDTASLSRMVLTLAE
jgi:hypothetical protein